MKVFRNEIHGVVWDWGDTLMRDFPGQPGPMAGWPRVEAMPGAAEALRALAVYPVHCVATNATESTRAMVAEALGRVGLRHSFTHFLTSSELGFSKPDPGFFEEVARGLRIPANRLLAVGNDLHKDIVPAKAVGMATILLSTRDEEPIARKAADLVVPNLVHLEKLFRFWLLAKETGPVPRRFRA